MSTVSLGQERIANTLKQGKRSFIISFSGGCDSTTILDILCKEIEKNGLKDECDIFLVYHHMASFRQPNTLTRECDSISDIMDVYKNKGFRIYFIKLNSELDETYTDQELTYGSYFVLPVMWILSIALSLIHI